MNPGEMMGPGTGIPMMLFWLLLAGLAVAAVVALVLHLSNRTERRRRSSGNDEAMDTARRRVARGEIDRSEFESTARTLTRDQRQKQPRPMPDRERHDRA